MTNNLTTYNEEDHYSILIKTEENEVQPSEADIGTIGKEETLELENGYENVLKQNNTDLSASNSDFVKSSNLEPEKETQLNEIRNNNDKDFIAKDDNKGKHENNQERGQINDYLNTLHIHQKNKNKYNNKVTYNSESVLEKENEGELIRSVPTVNTKSKGYDCPFCEINLKAYANLKTHLIIHVRKEFEEKYAQFEGKCPECQKEYKHFNHLSGHLASSHNKIFDFIDEKAVKRINYQHSLHRNIRLEKLKNHDSSSKKFICPYCEQGRNNYSHLKAHLYIHFKDEFDQKFKQYDIKCPECPKRSKNGYSELIQHLCSYHDAIFEFMDDHNVQMLKREYATLKRHYICPICQCLRKSYFDLKIHSISHFEEDFLNKYGNCQTTCMECSKEFKIKEELIIHIAAFHEKIFECMNVKTAQKFKQLAVCINEPQKFRRKALRVKTVTSSEDLFIKCRHCELNFQSLNQLKVHLINHFLKLYHDKYGDQNNVCPHCKKHYASKEKLFSHVAVFHKMSFKFEDEEGKKYLKAVKRKINSEGLRKHTDHGKSQDPHKESDSCDNDQSDQEEYLPNSDEEDNSELRGNFSLFNLDFIRSLELKPKKGEKLQEIKNGMDKCKDSNTKFVHEIQEQIMKRNASINRCMDCNETFKTRYMLNYHRKKIHLGKVYPCTECDKKFSKQDSLERHINSHFGKSFSCTDCNKTFTSSTGLKYHIDSFHVGKIHNCTKCDKKFIKSTNLMTHMDSVHSGNFHACTVCDKQFAHSGSLKTHMNIIHLDKGYACTECGKKFRTKHNLEIHINSMHSVQFHVCSTCNAKFAHSRSLKMHMKTIHLENIHSCTECDKQFSQSVDLKSHIDSIHLGKMHPCTECGKHFTSSNYLKKHFESVHGPVIVINLVSS